MFFIDSRCKVNNANAVLQVLKAYMGYDNHLFTFRRTESLFAALVKEYTYISQLSNTNIYRNITWISLYSFWLYYFCTHVYF